MPPDSAAAAAATPAARVSNGANGYGVESYADHANAAPPWGAASTTTAGSDAAVGGYPGAAGGTPPADAPTAAVPVVPADTVGSMGPMRPIGAGPTGKSTGDSSKQARAARARGPRRARLQLRHIDPWTVLKFSCVLSIALFFVWMIVVGVLYGVLDGAGIIDKINNAVTTLQAGNAQPPIRASIVFGGAAIIGVVNIVLFIALSTVGSVVYNLCADLVGGIEVTLSER